MLRTLDPSEQIFKIVYDELVDLMGPVDPSFHFAKDRPTVLMLCGLQGQGKTTTAGKLALTLRERGRKPLLVAADLQRPAAVDQIEGARRTDRRSRLQRNAARQSRRCLPQRRRPRQEADLSTPSSSTPPAGCTSTKCRWTSCGKSIGQCRPDQVYLVCDAMTGQDAVNSAKAFNDALDLNGVILTKMDGDARGGAALSIKSVAQVPIKFIGVGEKLDKLEEFRPEGMAQRILGQGDIMSLVEKVAEVQNELTRRGDGWSSRRSSKRATSRSTTSASSSPS